MHIYFSGIGGAAIGPLARLAVQAGYKVSGSDLRNSVFIHSLRGLDINLSIGPQNEEHIKNIHKNDPIDWFVHSSAVTKENADFQFALKHKIRISKRDEIINQIIKDNKLKLIAVSGTHGKTTTTAMLIWLFNKFNIPVSYSVGSALSFGDSASFNANSQYFVYEADEFDKNFLHFKPEISLITNVDYDHSDTYPKIKDYKKAYEKFAKQSDKVISWLDDTIDVKIKNDDNNLLLEGSSGIHPDIGLVGLHNRKNASLALEAFKIVDRKAPIKKLIATINSFPGTQRRFERIKTGLYTDYAHHPTEIKSTLQLAQEQISRLRKVSKNKRELIVLYQPHQNVRQVELQTNNEYQGVFDLADRVYWLPTYLSREDPNLLTLSPEDLFSKLGGSSFQEVSMDRKLRVQINKELKAKNVVVCMSAGDLDQWVRDNFMKISWRSKLQKFLPY